MLPCENKTSHIITLFFSRIAHLLIVLWHN